MHPLVRCFVTKEKEAPSTARCRSPRVAASVSSNKNKVDLQTCCALIFSQTLTFEYLVSVFCLMHAVSPACS